MNNTMQYKGYVGSVEFSEADGLFFGKVLGIRALISYEGTNAAELVADFHDAVDDYLSLCEAENSEPEKPIRAALTSGYHRSCTSRLRFAQWRSRSA